MGRRVMTVTEIGIIARHLILPTVIVVTLIAVYTDCRWRIIKNSLTLPVIVLGLLLHSLDNGWSGLGYSLFGALVGGGLMLIPFTLGQMGAGDVKLMSALGALLGADAILQVFLYTTIAGGFLALAFAAYHGSILDSFRRVWLLIRCIFLFRSPATGLKLFGESIPIPYGLAIGMGTAAFLLAGKVI